MPSQWPNRGSSLEAGLATMKRLTALSKNTILLYDPGNFPFQKEQLTLPDIPGELWVNFNMEDLVRNRFKGGGCNVWWSFV
ncbi:hypothetical protein HYH03_015084 [Edaphochlamys debaryana]|nr:hypothetical protein HYH03_015084 [Edaphochlamys debaryana]|eukprot:KAG2486260.1 hypothetical protein HYH03_015084 [Edaphochlamys debaryana]